jgi:formylglycine-generating enzyme required for sulfatase activity
MHGNVWEWCLDHWHESYKDAPDDGSAWLSSDKDKSRLVRGGSWYFNPWDCRSAYRDYYPPVNANDYIGFRVACAAPRTL